MSKKRMGEILFNIFYNYLEEKGFYPNAGQITDAGFVEVPGQRNAKEENEKIKAREGDQLWNDKPNKTCPKGVDARRTKKNRLVARISASKELCELPAKPLWPRADTC